MKKSQCRRVSVLQQAFGRLLHCGYVSNLLVSLGFCSFFARHRLFALLTYYPAKANKKNKRKSTAVARYQIHIQQQYNNNT